VTLTLERQEQADHTLRVGQALITPPIDETYWTYRVRLSDRQSVIGFPKFSTIGIGFAVEEDWNTNLPYTCQTIDIVSHIWHNAFSHLVPDEYGEYEEDISIAQVYRAVEMIQDAATTDRAGKPGKGTQPSMVGQTFTEVSL
jgi:hypothetical protein